MYRIKSDIIENERKLKNVLRKLEQRKLGEAYSGGCPHNFCKDKDEFYDKYRGCERFNSCRACWDYFLDDISIIKKSNMEAYYD